MVATDDYGAANDSDAETVTITITGTNDEPTLTIETSGSDERRQRHGPERLTDSGALSFTDLDVTDTTALLRRR